MGQQSLKTFPKVLQIKESNIKISMLIPFHSCYLQIY